ncbi:MAG: hypothetical protein R8K46_10650 [Mariprofundaceae bacterium]
MKNNWVIFTLIIAAISTTSVAMAEDMSGMHDQMQHEHGGMQEHGMAGEHAGMMDHGGGNQDMATSGEKTFLIKKDIDGYTVSFHVMKAAEGMQNGGTYNLMVKVEKDGAALTYLVVNSKVTHPNSKSESKMLMKMGDWYMASFDLGHDGQHQLMTLFKTSDGAKHFGGVYYPDDAGK